jgi:hypothetical protein
MYLFRDNNMHTICIHIAAVLFEKIAIC